jgi:hypothetical protein
MMGGLPEREYTDAEREQIHRQTCPGCVSCLRAENARLQELVEEAEAERDLALAGVRVTERERDGYKAQAEVRGKALAAELSGHVRRVHWNGVAQPNVCSRCKDLTAAIDALPEEAREGQ